MFDATKIRIFAAIAGVLLGLGGIFALTVAATLALSTAIGTVAATFTVAALMLSAACLSFVIFLKPRKSAADELEDAEEMTADALADLPFDSLKALVEKRPFTVAAIAMIAGYTLVRDPQTASRHAERFFLSMI